MSFKFTTISVTAKNIGGNRLRYQPSKTVEDALKTITYEKDEDEA